MEQHSQLVSQWITVQSTVVTLCLCAIKLRRKKVNLCSITELCALQIFSYMVTCWPKPQILISSTWCKCITLSMNRWTSSEWKSNFTTILWLWQEISCPGVCVWRTKLSSGELNVWPCQHSIKQYTLDSLPLLNFDHKQSSRLMTACIITYHPMCYMWTYTLGGQPVCVKRSGPYVPSIKPQYSSCQCGWQGFWFPRRQVRIVIIFAL